MHSNLNNEDFFVQLQAEKAADVELAAALNLISLGPQHFADPVDWVRVARSMHKYCKSKETVNEAAARIVADRLHCYIKRINRNTGTLG